MRSWHNAVPAVLGISRIAGAPASAGTRQRPVSPRRAHSSPRHACALYRPLFLHSLQWPLGRALYGTGCDLAAHRKPADPCTEGGHGSPAYGPVAGLARRANFLARVGEEVIR